MTYIEFRNKYNGQYVDVDGYPKEWKYQCFDLAQLYAREVIDVPDYVFGGCRVVKNLIYDPVERSQMDEFFDEIPTTEMQQGDISIWGSGEAGHIAIFDHYDPSNNQCYYFSQNPNPCEVMIINLNDHHAFRRKREIPPLPPVTPNVERDEYKDQLEVKVPKLRVRTQPTLSADVLGFAVEGGIYNYYEKADNDGYSWYKIADNQWVAYNEEWENVYPAKPKKEYIELEVLDKKDGYVLVDLGKVYVKEK